MATTPVGKFIGSDYKGGAAATGADAAEAGWLARGYRAVRDFAKRHYKVALGAAAGAGVMVAAEGGADAGLIPWNYTQRINSDWSNLGGIVSTPSDNPSDILNQSQGLVNYASNSEPVISGTLIFYDKTDRQVVGEFTLDIGSPGQYDLRVGGYGMFANAPYTPEDDGWLPGDEAGVLIKTPDGKFFDAYFAKMLYFDGGNQYIGRYDVLVTDTQIPEPSVLALLGLGSLAALARRPRKTE